MYVVRIMFKESLLLDFLDQNKLESTKLNILYLVLSFRVWVSSLQTSGLLKYNKYTSPHFWECIPHVTQPRNTCIPWQFPLPSHSVSSMLVYPVDPTVCCLVHAFTLFSLDFWAFHTISITPQTSVQSHLCASHSCSMKQNSPTLEVAPRPSCIPSLE